MIKTTEINALAQSVPPPVEVVLCVPLIGDLRKLDLFLEAGARSCLVQPCLPSSVTCLVLSFLNVLPVHPGGLLGAITSEREPSHLTSFSAHLVLHE